MQTESQIVVKLFCEKNSLKLNKTQFGRQLGIANNLLKEYNLNDITMVINYLYLFPPKNKIFSIGYLEYVMEELIPKAKVYYHNEENKNIPIKEIETKEIKNEVLEKKSMFSKNRGF